MEAPTTYRDLLKIPDLPMLMVSATLSRAAERMFLLTLVLFALDSFPTPATAGWLAFIAAAPGLAISPIAGAVLDRIGPTIAVRADTLASTLLIGLIALVGLSGVENETVLFFLVALFSLTTPLGASGTRTLIPRLVPKSALDRVNALDTSSWTIVEIFAPLTTGVLIAWIGAEYTFAVIAILFAAAAFCMFQVSNLPGLATQNTSLLKQTLTGIGIVVRQPTLRGLAISYSLYQMTWGILYVAVPVFVATYFSVENSSSITGLFWSIMGFAGGVGALIAGHLKTMGRERGVMSLGMILTALAAWPVAAYFGITGLVIGLILAGLVSGPIDVALLTLRQRRTKKEMLGRVMAISMSLNLSGFPIGTAIAGMVVASSLSNALLLAGLTSIVAALSTLTIPRDIPSA